MAIAFVQENVLNTAGNGSATTFQVTRTGVTAHNSLVVYAVVTAATPPGLTIADNVSGVWANAAAPVVSQALSAGNFSTVQSTQALFQCVDSPGGSVTVTVTSTLAGITSGVSLWISEWSGMGAVDTTNVIQNTGSGTSRTSPVITPSAGQTGDLVLVALMSTHAVTVFPTSPWNSDNGAKWFNAIADPAAYQVLAGTTGVSASWTSSAGPYGSIGAAFKDPTVHPATTEPIVMLV